VNIEKTTLFEQARPSRALAVMALPTVASQMVLLLYNLADTWFIGRTNNPYMVGASSLALTLYLAAVSLANVFGVGGGSLMIRLVGEKQTERARRVASYSLAAAAVSALAFSVLVGILMDPILRMLGASENTMDYARAYILTTTVAGGVPTVLAMCMPQLLRNSGYAREAGIGVGLGSLMNVALDPLFMFVLLPRGNEVLGAGLATLVSNCCSFAYFVVVYRKVKDRTVLELPRRIEKLEKSEKTSLYSVGIPAGISIFLYDLVTMFANRLVSAYGDIPLAAMGIVLKLERIPINTGLGICLGMVPLIAYNYGAGNPKRMRQIFSLARNVILGFSCICTALFWIFAPGAIGAFISDGETVAAGVTLLRGRCLSLPFMMVGYLTVNLMNAVNRGKVSFGLALVRHVVLLIPAMLLMNRLWGLTGLVWSQLAADVLNAAIAAVVLVRVSAQIMKAPGRVHPGERNME